jgi:DNA replication protein DnaC
VLDELTPSLKREKILELYSEITLTDLETQEALRKGREEKYYKLKREEYNEKLKKVTEPLKYNTDQVCKMLNDALTIDEYNANIALDLCRYFTDNPLFSGDLKKGLLVVGGIGVGKTTFMQFFKRNQKFSYRVVSCRDIENDFAAEGEKSLSNFSYNVDVAFNSNPFGHREIGFCFDDLGTESNGKHYGKEKNVMAEIILNRYDNSLPGHCTHITTNLTAEEIKSQYGSRVTDRMREMFNIITFDKNARSRRR